MVRATTPLRAAVFAIAAGGLILISPATGKPNERITVTGPLQDEVSITRVSYRDLNLAAAHDQARLARRVRSAVDQVCSDTDPVFLDHRQICRFHAWEDAKPQIARAIERARDLASNGFGNIAPVAIVISLPR